MPNDVMSATIGGTGNTNISFVAILRLIINFPIHAADLFIHLLG